jgi:hypothetical protein
MILNISQRKQLAQEIKEHTYTYACIEDYYILLETPKTKTKVVWILMMWMQNTRETILN